MPRLLQMAASAFPSALIACEPMINIAHQFIGGNAAKLGVIHAAVKDILIALGLSMDRLDPLRDQYFPS
jgi:hypothetical protein